jgi:protein-S-isoprenylcysteine O-methyltransferase Ste14
MALTFIALRSAVFACGFLWLWTWVALLLRRFDPMLGGPLAAWTQALGSALLVVGGAVAAWCIGAFVVQGRGTPALFDAPRRLVAAGPYRHVRNPMYIGGALLLLGLGLDQTSPSIVLFVPVWWLLFHLLVILYEEPTLRSKYGRDYDVYCQRTPRWIPRLMRPALSCFTILLLSFTMLVHGAQPKPGFTGEWKLNAAKSDFGPSRDPIYNSRLRSPGMAPFSCLIPGEPITAARCDSWTGGLCRLTARQSP